jgi:hypothetical protein
MIRRSFLAACAAALAVILRPFRANAATVPQPVLSPQSTVWRVRTFQSPQGILRLSGVRVGLLYRGADADDAYPPGARGRFGSLVGPHDVFKKFYERLCDPCRIDRNVVYLYDLATGSWHVLRGVVITSVGVGCASDDMAVVPDVQFISRMPEPCEVATANALMSRRSSPPEG